MATPITLSANTLAALRKVIDQIGPDISVRDRRNSKTVASMAMDAQRLTTIAKNSLAENEINSLISRIIMQKFFIWFNTDSSINTTKIENFLGQVFYF